MSGKLMNYIYAINMYEAAFSNQDMVYRSVLRGMDNAQKIYEDKDYGMNSMVKVVKWVEALRGG